MLKLLYFATVYTVYVLKISVFQSRFQYQCLQVARSTVVRMYVCECETIEIRIADDLDLVCVCSYGKIQYVHLAPRLGADKPSCVVAFMDIKSASRAVGSENVIDGQRVDTQYHEQQAAASSLGRPPAPSATTAEAMVAAPGGGSGIGEVARATNPSPGGLATKPASSSNKTEGWVSVLSLFVHTFGCEQRLCVGVLVRFTGLCD